MYKYKLTVALLLTATLAFGADIIRRKPTVEAPYRLEFVFTQIDSVDGNGTLYGKLIGWPQRDSTGIYTGRDTVGAMLSINWSVADTLRGVTVALDSTQIQGTQLYLAGMVLPLTTIVDSAAAAQDSLWLDGR